MEDRKLIELLGNHRKFETFLQRDDLLFHFTSSETAIKHILFEKQLKLNSLANMNDPWENKNFEHYYKNLDVEKFPEIFQKEKEIHKIKSHSKIACFCTNEAPKIVELTENQKVIEIEDKYSRLAFERSRMWNQYADNHKGVCIIFSQIKLIEAFQQQFSSKNLYFNYLKYSPQYLYFQDNLTINCEELLKFNNDIFIKKYIEEKKDYIFFSKNIDYRDESEFRIVAYDPDNTELFLNIEDNIEGVIIGVDCLQSEIKHIQDLCENLHVSCGIIEWRNGKPDPWPII